MTIKKDFKIFELIGRQFEMISGLADCEIADFDYHYLNQTPISDSYSTSEIPIIYKIL